MEFRFKKYSLIVGNSNVYIFVLGVIFSLGFMTSGDVDSTEGSFTTGVNGRTQV